MVTTVMKLVLSDVAYKLICSMTRTRKILLFKKKIPIEFYLITKAKFSQHTTCNKVKRAFPGSSGVKTLSFHCRGHGFHAG